MSNNIFKAPNYEATAQQLADCLPEGRAWGLRNIDGSNVRKLINSLSKAFNRVQQQVENIDDEFRISWTYDLLTDWEQSVGIPGECLGTASSIAQRRQNVIDRLKKDAIVDLASMQAYVDGLFPGLGLTIYPGTDYFTFEYDFEVPFLGDVSEKFILVCDVPISTLGEFEYTFEFEWEGGPDIDQLECLLNKINPASVYVLIQYVG